MKIKIFKKTLSGSNFFKRSTSSKDKEMLENEINDWLRENNGIEIKDIKQSCCGGSLEPGISLISIWYEPIK